MLNLENIYQALRKGGVDFITGVPDTLLNDFCMYINENWASDKHILAANEGSAIAAAAGYHLATGTVPLVYMQNSGLGNAINPLISLTDECVYSIPLVLVVGWRGEPGSGDWPQHQRQGELSPVLLDALKIPYRVLDVDENDTIANIEWAVAEAKVTSKPTALLVRKGVLAKKEKSGFDDAIQAYTVTREEAIKSIIEHAPANSIFVASTGRITRELYAIREMLGQGHEHDFLNVGAMGHALSIAAGIASANKARTVICLDGDAAALMHMGSMAITANRDLPRLIHIVLNNGAHESVGGQDSVAYTSDLTAIAKGAGYQTLESYVTGPVSLSESLVSLLRANKPGFIEFRIRKGMRSDMPILRADTIASKKAFITNMIK